jgi:hypothetical protein
MRIEAIPIGKNPPEDLNVIVEVGVPVPGAVRWEGGLEWCGAQRRPIFRQGAAVKGWASARPR